MRGLLQRELFIHREKARPVDLEELVRWVRENIAPPSTALCGALCLVILDTPTRHGRIAHTHEVLLFDKPTASWVEIFLKIKETESKRFDPNPSFYFGSEADALMFKLAWA